MMNQSKQLVLRYCKSRRLSVCMPTKESPEILVTDWQSGFGKHVAEGRKWADVERQLVAWQRAQFGL
jgi:hypothetical protein